MIVTDTVLRTLCEQHALVSPFDPLRINPASIDLCFGTTLANYAEGVSRITDISACTPQNPYRLLPGHSILASTLETLRIPANYVGLIRLKSSAAREHLFLAGAEYFDPGFQGIGTLGLFNGALTLPYQIWPGRRFCQLYLVATTGEVEQPYQGRYQGQAVATGSLETYQDPSQCSP